MKQYQILLRTVTTQALFLLFSISAIANDLPSAPNGYHWQNNDETKTAFLVPQKWNFHSEHKGATFGYFITKDTKENIVDDSQYYTGIMVNVIPGVTENLKIVPSKYMLVFVNEMKEKSSKVERQWEQNYGPFKGVGLEAIMGDKERGWRQHALFISNDTTGTLYVVIFETPIILWPENWPVAEKILKQLYLDITF